MPKGLHASDTHLRARRGDEEFAFRQIVDAAIREKVSYVCLAGDLLDKQSNRAKVIAFLGEQLGRLNAAGIAVLYTQGQHDYDEPSWFSAFPGTVHLHNRLYHADGVALYGLDWLPFGRLQEELAEVPENVDVLVCHQVWGDWMGDIAAPQGEFAQIPGHVRRVQTGDLHEWKLEKHKNADGESMVVLSTGATTQQKIDEPANHHYAIYDNGRFEKRTLKSRVMISSTLVTQPGELDVLVAELPTLLEQAAQKAAAQGFPPELERPYLRVNYHASVPDVVRRVEKAAGERAILNWKPVFPPEKVAAYEKAKAAAAKGEAVTPLSVLHLELDKAEEPATYELVSRVLAAKDPELEFAKWRAEFLGDEAG